MASLFKVLGNERRRDMLKILRKQEMHISGLARELKISVPVTLKHVKVLEESGLVVRNKVGNTHIINIPDEGVEKLNSVWMLLDEPIALEIEEGTLLSDALKKMKEMVIKTTSHGSYIYSVDGRKGFFVYEVNGKLVDTPINKYRLSEDAEIEIKRLVPALDKKIRIKVF
jgi:DNA-binding transcriptional ArsR family regulator